MMLTDPPRTVDKPVPDVEVLFPEAHRRRRRRRMGWLVATLCIALLIAVVAVARGQTSDRNTSSRTRPSTRIAQVQTPNEIVGWTSGDDLEVISTTTGAVERTLASDVVLFAPGLPTVSVSPGGVVFFDSVPTVGISPPDAQGDQIYSVPIAGGPVREVSPGYDPAISPDGQTLAFVASNGVGEAPYQLANGGIAARSTRTDQGSPGFESFIRAAPWSAPDSATCHGPRTLRRSRSINSILRTTSRVRGCSATRMQRTHWLQPWRSRCIRRGLPGAVSSVQAQRECHGALACRPQFRTNLLWRAPRKLFRLIRRLVRSCVPFSSCLRRSARLRLHRHLKTAMPTSRMLSTSTPLARACSSVVLSR